MASTSELRHCCSARTGLALETVAPLHATLADKSHAVQSAARLLASTRSHVKATLEAAA